jgi:hypothetical protein
MVKYKHVRNDLMPEEKRYLLHELRLQNDKEFDEKKNLDSKSSNIASYSVTFTVLLFGFGSFLLDKIETTNSMLFALLTIILVVSIILAIIAVVFSVRAFRLRDYWYVMIHIGFFREAKLPNDTQKWYDYLDTKEIESWIKDFPRREDYEDFMVREHLVALRANSLNNDNKDAWNNKAQLIFVLAVCMIPLILLVVLTGVLVGVLSIG